MSRTSVYSSGANNHCVAPHKGRYLFSPIDAHGFRNRFFRIGGKAMVGGSMLVSSESFDSQHCFWEHHYGGRKRQSEFLSSSPYVLTRWSLRNKSLHYYLFSSQWFESKASFIITIIWCSSSISKILVAGFDITVSSRKKFLTSSIVDLLVVVISDP